MDISFAVPVAPQVSTSLEVEGLASQATSTSQHPPQRRSKREQSKATLLLQKLEVQYFCSNHILRTFESEHLSKPTTRRHAQAGGLDSLEYVAYRRPSAAASMEMTPCSTHALIILICVCKDGLDIWTCGAAKASASEGNHLLLQRSAG